MTPSSKSHVSHPLGASPSAFASSSFFAEGSECLWRISSTFWDVRGLCVSLDHTWEFYTVYFLIVFQVILWVCFNRYRCNTNLIQKGIYETLYKKRDPFSDTNENIWQASDILRTKSLPEGGPAWEMALSPNGFFILRYPINRLCNYVKQIHAPACNVQASTTG